MLVIDPALVQTISDYRARLDAEGAALEYRDLGRRQPAVLTLVEDELAGHAGDLLWLGLDLLATVWRMLESGAEDPLRPVDTALVQSVHGHNRRMLDGLHQAEPRIRRRLQDPSFSRQPHIMRYVLTRCARHGQQPGEQPLGAHGRQLLGLLLRSAVDALHLGNLHQTAGGARQQGL